MNRLKRGREGPRLPYTNPRPAEERTHRHRHRHDTEDDGGRYKTMRGHFVAMVGEFVGTIMFLWFAFAGTQTAAELNPTLDSSRLVYVALVFGMSLLVTAWAFYRISGGLFNPAVLLGMVLSGSLEWTRALFLLPAEILGGIIAAALVDCMFPGPITYATTLSPGVSIVRGVFIEMFCTALLLFVILMLAAEKQPSTFVAPVGIGLALFVAELASVQQTGGSLNPARSFGPCVALPHFPGYHWIYWVGPCMGASAAAGFYRWVKWAHYEDSGNAGNGDVGGAERKS